MPNIHCDHDTIVAIATPLGEGGLGVVRLSGPRSIDIAAKFLSDSSANLSNASTHTLHHGWIKSGEEQIDEVVIGLFRKPKSYTGDDVVEISCHGSPTLLKEVVNLCQKGGARLARPGEFTERAFLSGKIDLIQAEAVADLIHSRSTVARQAAASQLRGVLSNRLNDIQKSLTDLLAHLEANLDFREEDIPSLDHAEFEKSLKKIRIQINELLATSLKGRLIREGIRVAIVGRPNVGKSSLFNAILSQERAIVTEIPGTTRDTIEEHIQWGAYPFVLTDTAGLRETTDPIEKLGKERTERTIAQADLLWVVLDVSEPLAKEDLNLLGSTASKKHVVILNKSDKKTAWHAPAINEFKGRHLVRASAVHIQGLEELKIASMNLVGEEAGEAENAPVITNIRHVHHLEAAAEKLTAAQIGVHEHRAEEAVSLDLREALQEINLMTGRDVSEEMLTSIFSRFCIGK